MPEPMLLEEALGAAAQGVTSQNGFDISLISDDAYDAVTRLCCIGVDIVDGWVYPELMCAGADARDAVLPPRGDR